MAENASYTPRLPLEVLFVIIQYLQSNPPDLLSACLTSSILRDEAQRVLFRHPSRVIYHQAIISHQIRFKLSKDQYPVFIDTILSSPDRLAPIVQTYTHRQRNNAAPEYLEKINNALRFMNNLKRLAFTGPHSLPAIILRGCTFQLDAFKWGDAEFAMEILQKFLPTQDSLRHLEFSCYRNFYTEKTAALAASVCPKLMSLTGTHDDINLFFKTRTVIYLHCVTTSDDWPATPNSLDDVLNRAFAGVQYLKYIPSGKDHLSELLGKVKSLVLLETSMTSVLDNNNIIWLLSRLPTLRVLILHHKGRVHNVDNSRFNLVRKIFIRCPQLVHVDLEVDSPIYKRFTRVSVASKPVRGITLTENAIFHDPDVEPPSRCDPHSSSYARNFASISAIDDVFGE